MFLRAQKYARKYQRQLCGAIVICFMIMIGISSAKSSDNATEKMTKNDVKKVLDIKTVKSTSGELEAWLVEDHSVPVISVRFFFEAQGAWYDENTQGITYLLSSMLDEGAGEHDSQSFQKMLEDYNLSLSFSGGRDQFGGSLYMLSKYQNEGFKALRLALTEPRFDEEPLERMRRQSLTSAKRRMGNPDWIAARLVNHYALPDHFYTLNTGGTVTNLERFSADDLRQFAQDNFAKGNLKIAVAGDITADELAEKLDSVFGTLPQDAKQFDRYDVSDFPERSENAMKISKQVDSPQTVVRFVWPSIHKDDPDYQPFKVMNYIWGAGGFSSRLMADIREERGLTYGVYSSALNFEKANRLVVRSSTAHENIPEMRERIIFQARRMAEEPVTDEELERAKNYLTGSLALSFTSTKAIGSGVMGLLYNKRPKNYFDGYKDRVRAVTKEDIQRVAKRLFDDVSPIEIYVGKTIEGETVTIVDDIPNVK